MGCENTAKKKTKKTKKKTITSKLPNWQKSMQEIHDTGRKSQYNLYQQPICWSLQQIGTRLDSHNPSPLAESQRKNVPSRPNLLRKKGQSFSNVSRREQRRIRRKKGGGRGISVKTRNLRWNFSHKRTPLPFARGVDFNGTPPNFKTVVFFLFFSFRFFWVRNVCKIRPQKLKWNSLKVFPFLFLVFLWMKKTKTRSVLEKTNFLGKLLVWVITIKCTGHNSHVSCYRSPKSQKTFFFGIFVTVFWHSF